jgi:hypothetical protein
MRVRGISYLLEKKSLLVKLNAKVEKQALNNHDIEFSWDLPSISQKKERTEPARASTDSWQRYSEPNLAPRTLHSSSQLAYGIRVSGCVPDARVGYLPGSLPRG